MSADKKAKVGPEHREESARLKALFNAYKLQYKISQAEFADRNGIGSQGNLSHYLNANQQINLAVAIKFAHALGCDVADFSPRLAAELAAYGPKGRPDASDGIELTPAEEGLIFLFRQLPSEVQLFAISTVRQLAELHSDHDHTIKALTMTHTAPDDLTEEFAQPGKRKSARKTAKEKGIV